MISNFNNAVKRLMLLSLFALFSFLCSANTWAAPGLFWKAESPAGETVYLFGTIHTDDDRVTEFPPAVMQALGSIDVFMMETQALQDNQLLMMSDGNLRDMLSQDELDKVYALTEFHVMHRAQVLRMKPWLLAAIFDSPRPLTPFAQDNLLMAKAEDFGKEVRGLETPAEHFNAMDSLSLEEQLLLLRAVLKRSDEQKLNDYEHLIRTYLAGDSDQLAALDEKITGGMLPAEVWQRMRYKLLDERNALMAARIIEAATSKKLFVAVGASHLAGETGLIVSLKRAGFKLSRLK